MAKLGDWQVLEQPEPWGLTLWRWEQREGALSPGWHRALPLKLEDEEQWVRENEMKLVATERVSTWPARIYRAKSDSQQKGQ